MKRFYLILGLFALMGCSVIKPSKQISNNQDLLSKQEQKIEATIGEIEKNDKGKKVQTSALSVGIQYSLQNITNPPVEVSTAKSLNDRVLSIIGSPHIDEANRIRATVDLLNSSVAEEREKGEALLAERDLLIAKLQKQNDFLESRYDSELQVINDRAKLIAKQADEKQAVINSMGGFFGLNAVFWGLKKFFVSCFTWIVVFGVIFLILRVLSTVNPIAGVAFSIFNMLGASVIGVIKYLTPKAFELSNFTSSQEYNKMKGTLVKIVDSVQELIVKQKDSPDKAFTIEDALDKFSKEMDRSEKETVKTLLKEQKWIK